MPRGGGGGGGGRRKPQSGKQKKEYLKQKKAARHERRDREDREEEARRDAAANPSADPDVAEQELAAAAPTFVRAGKNNPLTSLFIREDDAIVQARKARATVPIDLALRDKPLRALRGVDLGFPKRPDWDASTTPQDLERREEAAIEQWVSGIAERFNAQQVSPFEHNLEVWRQLWRTLEKSTVVVVVADVRNPLLHLPRALYDYVVDSLQRPIVVCLTKTDLVSADHLQRWTAYLGRELPLARVVPFSNTPRASEGRDWDTRNGVSLRRRHFYRDAAPQADAAWAQRESDRVLAACVEACGPGQECVIGVVGHPNVGKSSLVNALVGEKVVSVSKQCGHTKHWQTHVVHREGSPVATLCDSPGLIFAIAWEPAPGLPEPRHVFECMGLYPIPQIRETYSAIRFIGEHVPLETVYTLTVDEDDYGSELTPYAICGAFADKRGYSVYGGGPDFHRAGLEILRDTVDGFVLLAFDPPADADAAVSAAVPAPAPPQEQYATADDNSGAREKGGQEQDQAAAGDSADDEG